MQVRSVQRLSRRLPQHRALRRCATVIRACATTIVADASRAVNSPSRQQMLLMRRKFSGGARAAERGKRSCSRKSSSRETKGAESGAPHSQPRRWQLQHPPVNVLLQPGPANPASRAVHQHKQPTRRGGPVERTAEEALVSNCFAKNLSKQLCESRRRKNDTDGSSERQE